MRCRVEGCDGPVLSRGLCNAHYLRLRRYGDPLGGGPAKTPNGEALRYFREVVLTYEGDECLPWPYGRVSGGYGKIWHEGKTHLVHRLVCEEVNGPPPTRGHDSAHSCGSGHLACVAPRHLSWKTKAENESDKLVHGTHCRGERNGNAKLTKDDVRAILMLKGTVSQREVAKKFGVKQTQVWRIQRGESRVHG